MHISTVALIGAVTVAFNGCVLLPWPPTQRGAGEDAVSPATERAENHCNPPTDDLALERLHDRELWILCRYTYRTPSVRRAGGYFRLNSKIILGPSEINQSSDPGVWERLIGKLELKTKAAIATIRVGASGTFKETNPIIPLVAVARSSDGSTPPQPRTVNDGPIMPVAVIDSIGETFGFELSYLFSVSEKNEIAGSAIGAAQRISQLNSVGEVAGAVLSAISADDLAKVNSFISDLFSYSYASPPYVAFYPASEWESVHHMEATFYDAPKEIKARASIATVRIEPEFIPSLYSTRNRDGLTLFDEIDDSDAGKKISALGNRSTKDIANAHAQSLMSRLETNDIGVFEEACHSLPAVFAGANFSTDDRVVATWLILNNARMHNALIPVESCSNSFIAGVDRLGLRRLPFMMRRTSRSQVPDPQNIVDDQLTPSLFRTSNPE